MSTEEDTELRDLVSQALETKGVLSKIRAELRANVFLALEESNATTDNLLKNDSLHQYAQTNTGPIVLNLIREFLDHFDLGFTLSVFNPETRVGRDFIEMGRDRLSKCLGVSNGTSKRPLLCDIVESFMSNNTGHNPLSKLDFKNGNILLSTPDTGLSPGLNSTYTKLATPNGTPVNCTKKDLFYPEFKDEIEEDLISNKSSVSDVSSNQETPRMAQLKTFESSASPVNGTEASHSADTTPRQSIDLLTFTPVKEVKTKEKSEPGKPLSMLGDLPPLTGKIEPEGGKGKMQEIKAIMDQGLDGDGDNYEEDFHSSLSSKDSKEVLDAAAHSEESHSSSEKVKTDKSEAVEEELSVSELLNSHNSLESQLTVDETISHVTDVDHMESV